jgi:lipid-A-disaccharide synthase-like uncharacterized protein
MNPLATPAAAPDRPLAIGLLLGVSGWAAGLFVLFFVVLLFHPESAGQAAISGAILLGAAWALFMAARDGEPVFVAQLALALSIAGQCLALYAMTKGSHGIAPIAGAALALQGVLALAMPNRLHRTLSTLFATIAWALTLRFALFGEPGYAPRGEALHAISLVAALGGWLLAWCPVAAALWWASRKEADWVSGGWASLTRPVVDGLIVGLAVATLASQPFESFRWFGDGGADAGNLALWPLLSALGALGALAAAFALRRPGLMVLCAIATPLHVAHFYYALGTSLLAKSLLMLAMGAAFLVAARFLRSKEPA